MTSNSLRSIVLCKYLKQKYYLKKNHKLCTQLLEIYCLSFNWCFLFNCYALKVAYLVDLLRATDVTFGIMKSTSFISGLALYLLKYCLANLIA